MRRRWGRTVIPGWCSAVELMPQISIFGITDSAGTWTVLAPMSAFRGVPNIDIFTQYAFLDPQKAAVGLSDMAVYRLPIPEQDHVSSVWAMDPFFNSAGSASTGVVWKQFGLVTALQVQ